MLLCSLSVLICSVRIRTFLIPFLRIDEGRSSLSTYFFWETLITHCIVAEDSLAQQSLSSPRNREQAAEKHACHGDAVQQQMHC